MEEWRSGGADWSGAVPRWEIENNERTDGNPFLSCGCTEAKEPNNNALQLALVVILWGLQ